METKVKPTVETWLCRGYLFLMLALLPLAVHNGFFDITETKTICFTVPTVVFVLARLGFTLYRENGLPHRRLAGAEWAALALCLICFIASAAGGDFAGSFLGERGRYQGLGMMWLYAALYFAFSGARVRSGDVLVPLGLGLFLSGALTVCNHLGYDVLGFCSQLGEFDRGRYISTLGNINFAGAYLTLVWPVCAAALLTERRLWKGVLLGIVCVTGLWAAMAVRSESAVLGIGAALALLPLLAKKEPDALRRCPLLLTGTALSVLAYRAIVYDFGKRLSSLGRHFSEPAVMLPLAVLGAAAYFLLRLLQLIFSGTSKLAERCEITVSAGNNSITLEGIVDTGNSVEDIFGGGEVIIADGEYVKTLFGEIDPAINREIRSRYRVMPCGTVTGGGTLEAFRCDTALVSDGKRSVRLNKPILAVSKTPLKDDYAAIVNPRIFM